MTCSECGEKIPYPPDSTYDDLWFTYNPDESPLVQIHCPSKHCVLWNVIHEEEPRPKRYLLTFGKYEGKRLHQVPKSYLRYLKNKDDLGDALLEVCIKKLL